jgi:hypothetical protein
MLPRGLRESFAGAIRRMLKPVVRQLVAYGIPYPAFDLIVRGLYIEVADEDFALPFKRQTDSRVALVTGLSRKEVARLRRLRRDTGPPVLRLEESAAARVIGRWIAGPPYADRRGRPRPLPYEGERPRQASFARLVRELGVDAPVRSVLDELIRDAVVELLADGTVVLRQQTFIPKGDPEAQLALLASSPAQLFSTIIHNLDNPEAPWLERKVVYDNIGSDALTGLRANARAVGEEFVRRANALLAAQDRDRNPDAPGGERSMAVLGTYYFEAPFAESVESGGVPRGRVSSRRAGAGPGRVPAGSRARGGKGST